MKYWRKPLDYDQVSIPQGDVHIIADRCIPAVRSVAGIKVLRAGDRIGEKVRVMKEIKR